MSEKEQREEEGEEEKEGLQEENLKHSYQQWSGPPPATTAVTLLPTTLFPAVLEAN